MNEHKTDADFQINPEVALFINRKVRSKWLFAGTSMLLIFSYILNYLPAFSSLTARLGNSYLSGSLVHFICIICGALALAFFYARTVRRKFDPFDLDKLKDESQAHEGAGESLSEGDGHEQ